MADTTAALIQNVLRYFNATHRPERNRLNGAIASTTTPTLTFEFPLKGIQEGARVSVDLEDTHVWSVSESGLTATVERGDGGSTAATHADDAVVYVNPIVSWFDVLTAINDELLSLSSPATGLYRVKTDTFTYGGATQGYDLATDVIGIVGATYDRPDTSQYWPAIPPESLRYDPNADLTDFPSGKALTLLEGGFPGRTVRVTYKALFSPLTALTDVPATVSGLPVRAHQIVEMGAALRLAAARPIMRSFSETQGDTRRAEEATVGDALSAPGRLADLRDKAIAVEAARLAQEYGT